MFERFTDPARRIVSQSQERAKDFRHKYIGTEHLLLAMTSVSPEHHICANALASLNVREEEATAIVESIVGRGLEEQPARHIPFTPRSKKVLELALRESLQNGDNYIGTGHLLLGMIRESEGVGMQALRQACSPERLREITLTLITKLGPEERDPDLTVQRSIWSGSDIHIYGNQNGSYVRLGPFSPEDAVTVARAIKLRFGAQ